MNRNLAGDSSENISANPPSTCGASDTYAAAPFNDSRGDIILQTSDNVKYRVFKLILELASPIFRDMLSLPQPVVEDSSEQVPIVSVSESSATLGPLLEFCYPVTRPQLSQSSITQLGEVLRAAVKYDIDVATESICEALRGRAPLCEKDALEVYAVACNLKLEKEARVAATACLKWPVLGTSVPHLASISGSDLYSLLDFHRRAREEVVRLIYEVHFEEICSLVLLVLLGAVCYSCKRRNCGVWAEFKRKLKQAFVESAHDGILSVPASRIVSGVEQNSCSFCKESRLRAWDGTREAILAAINAKVSEVELVFSWK